MSPRIIPTRRPGKSSARCYSRRPKPGRQLALAERFRAKADKAQTASDAALNPRECERANNAVQRRGGKIALFLAAERRKHLGGR